MCNRGTEFDVVDRELLKAFSKDPEIAPELSPFGDTIHSRLIDLRAEKEMLAKRLYEVNDQIRLAEKGIESLRQASAVIENVRTSDGTVVADMDVGIEELDFSQRTFNGLRRAGLMTLRAIDNATWSDLASIRGFGKKSILEINYQLTEHGFQGKKPPDRPKPEVSV